MGQRKVVQLDASQVDVEYDKEGDALYISFGPETAAEDSEFTSKDVIIRYKGGKIIGMTVLHFSERQKRKTGRIS